jgi:hypothetical protein
MLLCEYVNMHFNPTSVMHCNLIHSCDRALNRAAARDSYPVELAFEIDPGLAWSLTSGVAYIKRHLLSFHLGKVYVGL